MFDNEFFLNRLRPLNFRRIWFFNHFIVTLNFKNSMYPRSFLSEEAKVKRHTSSKKELCEIGEEAIWESRFTCFFQIKKISVKQEEIMLTPSRIFFSQGSNQEPDIIIILLIRIFSCMAAVLSTSYPFFHFLIFRPYPLASR